MKAPVSKLMSPRIKMDYFECLKEKNIAWRENAEKDYVDNSVIAIRQRYVLNPKNKIIKRNVGKNSL